MLGRNLKVHFASCESAKEYEISLDAAGVEYRLYSCYRHINGKKPDSDFRLREGHFILSQIRQSKHMIQDSGLFTMLWGADRNEKITLKDIEEWQEKLVQFTIQNNILATIVECDCQAIVGVEAAWKLRYRLREQLPGRTLINAWHYQDGKRGLDRLIEFSDYIALSPEDVKKFRGKEWKEYLRKVAYYVKSKKPEIDIHLLGCTSEDVLKLCNFCTSADSTTWLQGVKYGFIDDGKQKAHIRNFRKDLFDERKQRVASIAKEKGYHLTTKQLTYCTNASLCASICKRQYIASAGTQD